MALGRRGPSEIASLRKAKLSGLLARRPVEQDEIGPDLFRATCNPD
jgi:hypothetical protein